MNEFESTSQENDSNTIPTEQELEQPTTTKKRKKTPPTTKSKAKTKAESETRRLAQASRTLKACSLCRKQKTRCFRSPDHPNSCLRCRFINKLCSFEEENGNVSTGNNDELNLGHNDYTGDQNDKLRLILDRVNDIFKIVKNNNNSNTEDAKLLLDAASSMQNTFVNSRSNSILNIDEIDQNIPDFQNLNSVHVSSPFALIRNEMRNRNSCPMNIHNLYEKAPDTIANVNRRNTLLDLGILTHSEVIELVEGFRRNYGRWVSFPSKIPTDILMEEIKYKSPLLLTTCCCISLRYSLDSDDQKENRQKYKQLINVLIQDLNQSFLKCTSFTSNDNGFVEFLQSLVVLSIYSTSISTLVSNLTEDYQSSDSNLIGFSLDPYQLSSIGLTSFFTKSTFQLFSTKNSSPPYEKLTILRIYNHLCLVHVINCLFSGRMCILDDTRINYCKSALSLFNATNFDGRMVSEINILYITYKYIQQQPENIDTNFKNVQQEVQEWFINWEYLLQQPALQFVEFNYNFCSMLILFIYCFHKCSTTQDSLNVYNDLFQRPDLINHVLVKSSPDFLLEIFKFAKKTIDHIEGIANDSYFAYLSDQIHFCFYFSGILIIKILKLAMDNQYTQFNAIINNDDIDGTLNTQFDSLCKLIEKFDNICMSSLRNDIISVYKSGLEESLYENFQIWDRV
ncbi:hypothetical protein KGF54_001979 [Candida jiufengensis]|uniref:uncharacterized protein n=1 Tax=Candida jiufengensis TaxID=497108 RepID=UPI0022252E32|nr:uncharacterized protein KGF54_001979 [Candida jiufengensis]KAI5954204.1 hypothetical protein KGF54_001979 [Candida jiufengensis]